MSKQPRIRNKGIRKVRVADLEDAPWNFRTHGEHQKDAFAGTVEEIGWYGYPDVYKTEQGKLRICDGHLRKEHLLEQYGPDAEIEVNVTDFDEADARKATASHDPLSALAGTDRPKLDALLQSLDVGNADLENMLAELAKSNKLSTLREPEQDEAPEPPAKPVSKPGEIWAVGKHRVLVGDATDPRDYDRLLKGTQPDCIFTDPPYNVDYGAKQAYLNRSDRGNRNESDIDNDTLTNPQFAVFLRAAYGNMFSALKEGCPIYVFHADSIGHIFRAEFMAAGFLLKQVLQWVKQHFVLGRQDYHWQHEPIPLRLEARRGPSLVR